jgi:SAM-dependent methyltransferase
LPPGGTEGAAERHILSGLNRLLGRRRKAWNEATKKNALYYIAAQREDWTLEDFFASGEALVSTYVDPFLREMGVDARGCRAVEIGAGVGRLSRALANRFDEVIAVDISPAMIAEGINVNADLPKLHLRSIQGLTWRGSKPRRVNSAFQRWYSNTFPVLARSSPISRRSVASWSRAARS